MLTPKTWVSLTRLHYYCKLGNLIKFFLSDIVLGSVLVITWKNRYLLLENNSPDYIFGHGFVNGLVLIHFSGINSRTILPFIHSHLFRFLCIKMRNIMAKRIFSSLRNLTNRSWCLTFLHISENWGSVRMKKHWERHNIS